MKMKRGAGIFSKLPNSSFCRHWQMSSAVDSRIQVSIAALSWTKPNPPERFRQPLSKTFGTFLFRNLTLEPFNGFLKFLNFFHARARTYWSYFVQNQIQMVLNDYKLFRTELLRPRDFNEPLKPIDELFRSQGCSGTATVAFLASCSA